jgi:hypothetical protein
MALIGIQNSIFMEMKKIEAHLDKVLTFQWISV